MLSFCFFLLAQHFLYFSTPRGWIGIYKNLKVPLWQEENFAEYMEMYFYGSRVVHLESVKFEDFWWEGVKEKKNLQMVVYVASAQAELCRDLSVEWSFV